MKVLIALLAVAGLSGCAAYGVPYGSAEVYYGSGSPYYGYGGYYGHSAPYVIDQRPTYIYGGRGYDRGHGRWHGRGYRDRDGDGIANRYDRDRDGDGVSNRRDAYPNNPRRQ
jgi:hypothetical protein